jgi:hypothetical protein
MNSTEIFKKIKHTYSFRQRKALDEKARSPSLNPFPKGGDLGGEDTAKI